MNKSVGFTVTKFNMQTQSSISKIKTQNHQIVRSLPRPISRILVPLGRRVSLLLTFLICRFSINKKNRVREKMSFRRISIMFNVIHHIPSIEEPNRLALIDNSLRTISLNLYRRNQWQYYKGSLQSELKQPTIIAQRCQIPYT